MPPDPLASAWLLHRGEGIVYVASAIKVRRLAANAAGGEARIAATTFAVCFALA